MLLVSHEASRTGAPRVAVQTAEALAADGWEVVVCLRWGGPLEQDFRAVSDRLVMEPLAHLRALLGRTRWMKRSVPRLQRWAARRVVRRTGPDLVWCNTAISAPYARAASESGVPSVVFSHEHAEIVRRSFVNSDLTGGVWSDLACPPRLVACAPAAATTVARVAGVDPIDVRVIRPGVDVPSDAPQPRTPPGGRPVVVAVGLGNRGKGVDVFASAAERSRAGAVWRWVGEVVDASTSGNLDLVGPVPSSLPWLRDADVVVLPSRADAFPLVVLEAMALGRPVVASDLPGPREQLDDTGVLVPPEDPAALAREVDALLADPERAGRLGAAARERCRQLWGLERFAAIVREVADSVAPAPRPARVVTPIGRLSPGGGIQIVIRRLAQALDPAEVDLQVLTVRRAKAPDRLDELPITVHSLPPAPYGYPVWSRALTAARVGWAMRRLRPDVVHLHSGTAWLGLVARTLMPRTAFLLEVHDAPGSGRHGRLTDRVEGWWPRWLGATVLCHSRSVAEAVAGRWRVPSQRVKVIPLAVDTDLFRPATGPSDRDAWRERHGVHLDAVVCLAVGRFVPSKRLDEVVRAAAAVESVPVEVVVVGGGDEEATIRAAARSSGLTDRLHLTGPLYGDELADAYRAADVLCSASEYEGFGLTIVEAMACGLPVVATAVGGVTDLVVDGVTGRLVAPGDRRAFTAAISELAEDPVRRAEWGHAARARAESEYAIPSFAGAVAALYRGLVGGRVVRG